MERASFEEYITAQQELMRRFESSAKGIRAAKDLVNDYLFKTVDDESYHFFFQAERAYLNSQYRLALKYYSKSRQVPNFRFFCHRATAHIFQADAKKEHAMDFAQKALELCPTDYFTLELMDKLLMDKEERKGSGNVEAAQPAVQAYSTLPDSREKSRVKASLENLEHCKEEDSFQAVSLAKKEMEALSSMFDPLEEEKREAKSPRLALSQASMTHAGKKSLESSQQSFEEKKIEDPYLAASSSKASQSLGFEKDLTIDDVATVKECMPQADIPHVAAAKFELRFTHYDPSEALEKTVQQFQERQNLLISKYVTQSQKRPSLEKDFIYILSGWHPGLSDMDVEAKEQLSTNFLLPEYKRRSCGGVYIRFAGKGLVINPGINFLERFHQHGMYVKDIDYVIVTRSNTDAYADVQGIYELNYQHNLVSQDKHVIHYYLNPTAHGHLANSLQAKFKQEKNTLHCLEIYLDSTQVESIHLSREITLNYFHPLQGSKKQNISGIASQENHIAMTLDLHASQGARREKQSLAFLSGLSWHDVFVQYLASAQIVIAAFEETCSDDYKKIRYNLESLGYFGSYSLAQKLKPELLLLSEFSGREGDIRMEVIKKMRTELSQEGLDISILPADLGMYLDLNKLSLRCSVSSCFVRVQDIRVAKSKNSFGQLQYLSPSCFI